MKDYLREAIRAAATPLHARSLVREYLQARALAALQNAGAFVSLAFHGGTALRFLYSIPRWSEDLDFALERSDGYDLHGYLDAIRVELARETYRVDLSKVKADKVVHGAFVRFPGLLNELGLSPHASETLAVKIEVDTRPPQGAKLDTTVVRRHVLIRVQHHDKASLLAGKLHAVLQREYPKGRDLFDLLWYLGDRSWPEPNLEMLRAALDQSGWTGRRPTPKTWRRIVRARLKALPWDRVVADVRPFIERPADLDMLTEESLLDLLS